MISERNIQRISIDRNTRHSAIRNILQFSVIQKSPKSPRFLTDRCRDYREIIFRHTYDVNNNNNSAINFAIEQIYRPYVQYDNVLLVYRRIYHGGRDDTLAADLVVVGDVTHQDF